MLVFFLKKFLNRKNSEFRVIGYGEVFISKCTYNVTAENLALTLRGRAELIVVSVRSMDDYYCQPMK